MNKLSLKDLPLKGQRVLMRVDFNVPMEKGGGITDDTRIKETLPSIQYILDQGGSVVLMSHLGRPKGKRDPQFSLTPCAKRLEELLKKPVRFASDCIGAEAEKMAKELKSGEVLLLENLRFYPAEEDPKSDPFFAKQLAALGQVYVNDAFGAAHRAHSSTAVIAQYFPGKAAAGFLMEKEINFLSGILSNAKRPFYALIGGAKISTKMGVLQSLTDKVDAIFIGGGMAYTFLKAQGMTIGDSIVEDDQIPTATAFLQTCQKKGVKVWLPEDIVIANAFKADAQAKIVTADIPAGWQGMDIGPKTLQTWKDALKDAATVFWNGPLGVYEFPAFAKGTEGIARLLSTLSATTIVGGGDSVAAINALHLGEKFSHLSTGGGASLEYLEFGKLPGIDALSDRN
jgi:phosphoglycerate kinase